MNLLITGATGFLGTNFCRYYRRISDVNLLLANSTTPRKTLKGFVERSDVILHFAAAQRPADSSEFNLVNVGLTEFIVGSMCRDQRLIFSSSVHASLDTDFGRSKLLAENTIRQYFKDDSSKFQILRLPHVYGPHGRPNYTSVLHTYCYCISKGLPIKINNVNIQLEFLYIMNLVQKVEGWINGIFRDNILDKLSIDRLDLIALAFVLKEVKDGKTSSAFCSDTMYENLQKTYIYYASLE